MTLASRVQLLPLIGLGAFVVFWLVCLSSSGRRFLLGRLYLYCPIHFATSVLLAHVIFVTLGLMPCEYPRLAFGRWYHAASRFYSATLLRSRFSKTLLNFVRCVRRAGLSNRGCQCPLMVCYGIRRGRQVRCLFENAVLPTSLFTDASLRK